MYYQQNSPQNISSGKCPIMIYHVADQTMMLPNKQKRERESLSVVYWDFLPMEKIRFFRGNTKCVCRSNHSSLSVPCITVNVAKKIAASSRRNGLCTSANEARALFRWGYKCLWHKFDYKLSQLFVGWHVIDLFMVYYCWCVLLCTGYSSFSLPMKYRQRKRK